jgi:hypothetical protein
MGPNFAMFITLQWSDKVFNIGFHARWDEFATHAFTSDNPNLTKETKSKKCNQSNIFI